MGEWTVEAVFPDSGPTGPGARARFEWVLGGQFLVQHSEVPHPAAPDGLSIIAANHDGDGFTQHYFDSRGVVRVYEMTFDGRVWTLAREKPDFTPLDFAQRWMGTLSQDREAIDGRWETKQPGSDWEPDFDLTYRKVPA